MSKTENEVEEEFGPVCLYKGGESQVCNTTEELKAAEKAGWKDAPEVDKKAKD